MHHALQMQTRRNNLIARMGIAQKSDAAGKRKERGKDKNIGKSQRLRPRRWLLGGSPVMLLAAMAPS